MKKLLKKIRLWSPVNIPVRSLFRAFGNFSRRINAFFSLHWPVSGNVSFRLPGGETAQLYSKGDDYIPTQLYWKGYAGYEGASVALFYELSKRSQCIIDIGANIGFFSVVAGCANPNANIYAFEPVSFILDRLKKNALLNGLANVHAEQLAAGNKDENISFFLPEQEGIPFSGSAKKGWAEKTTEISVRSVRLDTFRSERQTGKIDLVKMDCEFHEKEVLQGMKQVLATDQPLLLTEILFPESDGVKGHFENAEYLAIEQLLRDAGYYFYLINATALVRVDRLEYNPDDRNYLFSPKKSSRVYLPYSDMASLLNEIA